MESGCFAVVLFGLAVGALIVAINANSASTALRAELAALRKRLDELQGSPAPVKPEPAPEPEIVLPVPEPEVPPIIEPPTPPPPPPPPPPVAVPPRSFDWESLVGVKLFSWIAGVALVLAAVFFLKYSVDHGWLSPIVRATLGLVTGTALLVVCEMRVARDYTWTANAMHGAGIAILYATLFSIHALWQLLPAGVVFALMLVVTAIAVTLSIRRDSVFIALLGLMGGFATPALLATTHRPIELFSYLLLLNGGLAWVAYRKRWVALTIGSLIFTLIYQWFWIARFLTVTQLPLAAAVFAVFALVGTAVLWLRGTARDDRQQLTFERLALASAILPLTFAIFGAAVPAYGLRYNTLFGFLLFMAAGLAIIGKKRGPAWLHVLGGAAVLLTFAVWISVSYRAQAWPAVLAWVGAFVILYLIADSWGRGDLASADLARAGSPAPHADRTAALLLFVFPILAAREPATSDPAVLFTTLFVLLAVISAYAIRSRRGVVYFIAAFLAIVTQGVWSARHLTRETLLPGLLVYAAFGLLLLAAPILARRAGRPLQPAIGVPVTVLSSLAVLLFLTGDGVASAAIWGLAILLPLLMIGLFIESRFAGRPLAALAGVILGWIVLASWWEAAPLAASFLAALFLITLFAVVVLAASVWTESSEATYLAATAHLFLLFAATQPALAIPPGPLFAVLALINLAIGTAALYLRRGSLMIVAGIASQIVAIAWAAQSSAAPWPNVALALGAGIAAWTIAWYLLARTNDFGRAAVSALFLGHVVAIVAGVTSGVPLFTTLLITHLALAVAMLAIAWTTETHVLATFLVPVLAIATALSRTETPGRSFAFAAAIYVLFVAYPLFLGRRAQRESQPYLAAVLAAVPFFFFARSAMIDGGYRDVIGVLPVAQAAIMIVLLVRLMRIEPPSERMLGRLALVAAAALAFITVAIPLQLDRQWVTIGWALEAAALVWLFRRVPHRGLLGWAGALFVIVLVRLVIDPTAVDFYFPTYAVSAAAFFVGARLLSAEYRKQAALLSAAGMLLLFLLLNLSIADFYSSGAPRTFNFFSASLAQELTYTIGWALFALAMLIAGIVWQARAARIAALSLLVITILKCFLHDLGRLGGLYRVGSLLGLAVSLVLVGILLQKFVLRRPLQQETA